MRALPAGSFEYFGETAVGKAAVAPEPTPVVVGVLPPLGTAAFASVAGVLVGAADAVGPHSTFRNSLHVFPCNVPADCAALYLTLHSFIVMAFAAEDAAMSNSATASMVAHDISERVDIEASPCILRDLLTGGTKSPVEGMAIRRGLRRSRAGPYHRSNQEQDEVFGNCT
jgi:hypothetical protein